MAEQPETSGSRLGNPLEAGAVDELSAGFKGRLIQPEDPGYDGARAVFNGMIDRRPALIARCTGPADVVAAIAVRPGPGLVVAVRAGGHSVPGLRHLRRRDHHRRGADEGAPPSTPKPASGPGRVGPHLGGVRSADPTVRAGHHRRPPDVGAGVAGQTLGSGSGWLERKYGLTCDNLLAAELVTADGEMFVPEHLQGRPALGLIICCADDATPHGLHNYWKAENLPELSDAAIDTIITLRPA